MNSFESQQPVRLCAVSDLDATGAKSIVLGTGLEQKRYIVVRSGGEIRCYINRCPHQGTPLDIFPDKFLDESGDLLVCSTHGARFRARDGFCVSGPCQGERLDGCEIVIGGGTVYLAAGAGD